MNDIMEKTFELIDVLDNSDIIKNIDMYKKRILGNSDICELIKKAKSDNIDKYELIDIKKRLYDNGDYKGYMDNYNKLFYIVMDINNRFNKLLSNRSCKI